MSRPQGSLALAVLHVQTFADTSEELVKNGSLSESACAEIKAMGVDLTVVIDMHLSMIQNILEDQSDFLEWLTEKPILLSVYKSAIERLQIVEQYLIAQKGA